MSLVGRVRRCRAWSRQTTTKIRRRLGVLRGMTGLWQVSGPSDLSWEEAARLDLHYVDNWSMLQDFSILVRTGRDRLWLPRRLLKSVLPTHSLCAIKPGCAAPRLVHLSTANQHPTELLHRVRTPCDLR
ncbi:sugar transferase [Nocardioides alkalitolerans]|uniref:sugar transferase n=1 Tax=Nocardioides alkalitolerans TaxID=281714 RepID=UPI001B7FE946|nr:sugar transferase [Nocardioides alkalitolerans]